MGTPRPKHLSSFTKGIFGRFFTSKRARSGQVSFDTILAECIGEGAMGPANRSASEDDKGKQSAVEGAFYRRGSRHKAQSVSGRKHGQSLSRAGFRRSARERQGSKGRRPGPRF